MVIACRAIRPFSLRQAPGADPEEAFEVLVADRFDHLDRHQLVEGAAQVAVVLEQDLHPILEARRRAPAARA